MAGLACQEQSKDTIDAALLQYSKLIDIDPESHQCVSFTPFEPATKRSGAVISSGGKNFRVIKGAPQTVIALCKTLDERSKRI